MKARELSNLGIPKGPVMKLAQAIIAKVAKAGMHKQQLRQVVGDVAAAPEDHTGETLWGELASALIASAAARKTFEPRTEPAPWRQWGRDLDDNAIQQLEAASRLPVAVCGALMPDAHTGYGLPIGGVLATDNAVIPFAVGMDIACRMKMSVLDLPVSALTGQTDRLKNALHRETCFGVGGGFHGRDRRRHDVIDEDWSISPVTAQHKDKAWKQLGSSGSGNHFAEFGVLTLESDVLDLPAGEYLALLSHSGSRGVGGSVAQHYSKLAMELHPELPRELIHLAWFDLDSQAGQEYWAAMELMGRYAAANHQLIHRHVSKNLGATVLADIENHHNFAWKEIHGGRGVIVHRKGATPAETGVLGIIPGSMATPCYIVRGKGCAESLNSASHGAGRRMSRKKAKETFTWSDAKKFLTARGVELISAGLDEVPMAYKDIDEVMAAQQDLVEAVARFDPKLVKMAPGGERPED